MSDVYVNAPSRLQSYVFWKQIEKTKPHLLKGFVLGQDSYQKFYATFGDKCYFCNGFQQFRNSDINKNMYCICSMCRWLDQMHMELAEVETIITPAKLNDLKPLEKYSGAKTLRKTKELIVKWVENPQMWFLISGNTGNGKTHILRSIKTYFKSAAIFISSEDLNSAIYRHLSSRTLDNFVTLVSSAPILLLDDYGIEHTNPMFNDVVAQIVNRRYNAGPKDYPMMVTTNISIGDLLNSPNISIRRVVSRLMDEDISYVIKFEQPDYRLATTEKP